MLPISAHYHVRKGRVFTMKLATTRIRKKIHKVGVGWISEWHEFVAAKTSDCKGYCHSGDKYLMYLR